MKRVGKLLLQYLLFFAIIGFVLTCSFLLFFSAGDLQEVQIKRAALATFINTLFLAAVFLLTDTLRRKWTVDRPVRKINDALARISQGDFSVRPDSDRAGHQFAPIMECINRMTEELAGVETLRSDFVANVSHEMKTPLAVIRNYAKLLQEPELSDEQRQEYAALIGDTARKLAALITNVLRLNRLENQQIYPQSRRFDLGEQLCRCLLNFEQEWERKDIALDANIGEDVTVQGDEELLELVWNNLLSNAFKFTPEGGSVAVSLEADGDFALVSVSDTGCGMTAEVGAHMFEKFYQGDTSHATAGNGLGLALVKRVMDITSGSITVKSAPGAGSTFTVRLPRNL